MIPSKDVAILINAMTLDDLLRTLQVAIVCCPHRSPVYNKDYVERRMDIPTTVHVYCDLWDASDKMRNLLLRRVG